MTHTINKNPLTFYVDWHIVGGFLYVYEETKDDRVISHKICPTNEVKIKDLKETEKKIIVVI